MFASRQANWLAPFECFDTQAGRCVFHSTHTLSQQYVLARIIILCHPAGMTKTEKQLREELEKEIRRSFASKGGKALAKQMTPEQRKAAARKAAKARWAKARKEK